MQIELNIPSIIITCIICRRASWSSSRLEKLGLDLVCFFSPCDLVRHFHGFAFLIASCNSPSLLKIKHAHFYVGTAYFTQRSATSGSIRVYIFTLIISNMTKYDISNISEKKKQKSSAVAGEDALHRYSLLQYWPSRSSKVYDFLYRLKGRRPPVADSGGGEGRGAPCSVDWTHLKTCLLYTSDAADE